MIERIARALHARSSHTRTVTDAQGGQPINGASWDELTDDARRPWLADAAVALSAMREPDQAMKAAGAEFFEEGDAKQNAFAAAIVYEAMVEAAIHAQPNSE